MIRGKKRSYNKLEHVILKLLLVPKFKDLKSINPKEVRSNVNTTK